eukprot:g23818.t1
MRRMPAPPGGHRPPQTGGLLMVTGGNSRSGNILLLIGTAAAAKFLLPRVKTPDVTEVRAELGTPTYGVSMASARTGISRVQPAVKTWCLKCDNSSTGTSSGGGVVVQVSRLSFSYV